MPVLRRLEPLIVGGWTMLLGDAAVLPLAYTAYPDLSEPMSSVGCGAAGAAAWTAAPYSTVLCSAFAIAAWQASGARLGANRILVLPVPGDAGQGPGKRCVLGG